MRVLLSTALLLLCQQASLADIICPQIVQQYDTNSLIADDPSNSEDQRFNEISGLAFSPTTISPISGEPVLYAINDSGGGKRLGIFDSGTGERILTLRLSALPSSRDWESMAIGSCGTEVPGGSDSNEQIPSCLYIADIGDNLARGTSGDESGRNRSPYRIYKIKEPQLDMFSENDEIPSSHMSVMDYDYQHSSSPTSFADCEAVFLDHTGWGNNDEAVGDMYLVTKWDLSGTDAAIFTRLFRIPASAWTEYTDRVYSPTVVGTYDSTSLLGKRWTRGDMAFDGTTIALGDYYYSYLFPRCPGVSVADALAADGVIPCRRWDNLFSDDAGQFETIAWLPDGSMSLQISECRPKCNPPMVWTVFDYTDKNGASTYQCPSPTAATEGPTASPRSNEPSQQPLESSLPTALISAASSPIPTSSPTKQTSPPVAQISPSPTMMLQNCNASRPPSCMQSRSPTPVPDSMEPTSLASTSSCLRNNVHLTSAIMFLTMLLL